MESQTLEQKQNAFRDAGVPMPAYTASATDVASASPVIAPPNNTTTPDYQAITAGVVTPYDAEVLAAQQKNDSLMSSVESDIEALGGKNQFVADQEQQLDISGKTQVVNSLTNQLKQLANETKIGQLTLNKAQRGAQDQSIVQTNIDKQQADLARQQADIELPRAIQALTLASALDYAKGDLDAAEMKVQKAVDLKYKTMEDEVNYRLKLLDLNSTNLSKKEQKQADYIRDQLNLQKTELADKKKMQQDVVNAAQTALDNRTASAAMKLDPNSSTFTSDLAKLQGDMLAKNENVWSSPYRLGGDYVQKNTTTGEIRVAVNTPASGGGSGGGSIGGSGSGSGGGGVSPITQSIIANPSLFDNLTATVRGNVISELQSAGYDTTNLGTKGLSDGAIAQLTQSQSALNGLNDLKDKIAANVEYIGPLKGMARLNPYSKARQIQADVDRIRQTVGKALEGGVLRKEDEEKYKKILATLTDTPETAVYKIDALFTAIQKDMETYKSLQASGGRSTDIKASLQKKGAKTATPTTDLRAKYNY